MNNQTDRADGPTDATEERRSQTEICPTYIGFLVAALLNSVLSDPGRR